MLINQNGDNFTTGVMDYVFGTIPPDNTNNRIILEIKIEPEFIILVS